jgi:hypothetical protein
MSRVNPIKGYIVSTLTVNDALDVNEKTRKFIDPIISGKCTIVDGKFDSVSLENLDIDNLMTVATMLLLDKKRLDEIENLIKFRKLNS